MSAAWYNENDPFPAAWLRNLIAAGRLPAGTVDERSIEDVHAADLADFTQCHFFAGIGGWPLALKLAGWPDDAEVWTGSCPCQPLSGAGLQKGHADKRHLWPAFHRLIAERRPATVFGEQVASGDGREWLAGVRADLEALGYAVGAADLPAASVGAPHIRQRLWWVADAHGWDASKRGLQRGREFGQQPQDGGASGLADSGRKRRQQVDNGIHGEESPDGRESCRDYESSSRGSNGASILADANGTRWPFGARLAGDDAAPERAHGRQAALEASPWSGAGSIHCTDRKTRRVEPGISPLAHGVPGRVGKIRAAGNAIVPQVAAKFVRAFMEAA